MNLKESIKANREITRLNVKKSLITPILLNRNTQEYLSPQHTVNRRRRKNSEVIRVMDDINYINQIVLSNEFEKIFRIEQKLGEGSQSVVYRCCKLDTEFTYAVKVIKTREEERKRSLKEQYRILKTLNHENIIQAHYLYIDQKRQRNYMICQYFSGRSLRSYLNEKKTLREVEMAYIIQQLLNTLNYLHQRRVCHRDIKPDNILYKPLENEIKVIDFQISKMAKYQHQNLQMWTQTGTLNYKAPQMFSGMYDEKVDIWALGIIAYQMVFGEVPFQSQYTQNTIKNICHQKLMFPLNIVSQLCLEFISKLLDKDPIHRIQAKEALQSPFILKNGCTSPKSRSNRSMKKNDSDDDEKNESKLSTKFYKDSLDDLSSLNGYNSFSVDIGIRFLTPYAQKLEKEQKIKGGSYTIE